jgi:hypothetical protein
LTQDGGRIFITFKYSDLSFSPPQKINSTLIIFLFDIKNQQTLYTFNGVFRYLEIEPVEVVKNYLHVKININLSIDIKADNFDIIKNNLSSYEKNRLIQIAGPKPEPKSLFLNIEKFSIDFLYDCDNHEFRISNHKRHYY